MMKHETVLLNESIQYLNIKPDGIYVDATLGGAGHSELILKNLTTGFLYAFDQDEYAIKVAKERLKNFNNFEIIHSNFSQLKVELNKRNISHIDGILMDLGMSSFQIDDVDRGFTYLKDTALDMRMDQRRKKTAKEVLNTYSLKELTDIFYQYGEEKNSYRIANMIIKNRPIDSTKDLVRITDIVNKDQKGHSAKRVFQALRIEVNDELDVLKSLLNQSVELLNPGGRIVALTFHSLEDRIVKHFFKEQSASITPKELFFVKEEFGPLKVVTNKPIYPSEEEMNHNGRSKSAKLRAAERR